MKAVVIGESSGAPMETIMSVYPRHKAVVEKYIAQGVVIGIGPFSDRGNMAIFKTREAAEQFVKEDATLLPQHLPLPVPRLQHFFKEVFRHLLNALI